jgi:hypothetical protein
MDGRGFVIEGFRFCSAPSSCRSRVFRYHPAVLIEFERVLQQRGWEELVRWVYEIVREYECDGGVCGGGGKVFVWVWGSLVYAAAPFGPVSREWEERDRERGRERGGDLAESESNRLEIKVGVGFYSTLY